MNPGSENTGSCGHTIPEDAPFGMCPLCLLGGDPVETEEASPEKDSVGNFRIEGKLGEGGFAEVFEAEQLSPVRRRVALKMLRPEVATSQVLVRFEAERQALALMDHPNIAAVFDAGETDTGRRWVSMELVDGEPITQFAGKNGLSRNDKLRLFLPVCRAVQHAHLKGVIHRDLKPSNILVAQVDGKAVPKVIDFGIARAIDVSLTDSTLYTDVYQLVGTPGYMSPEQASFDAAAIDGRSDIYSLGVVLYEMLCGKTPFESGSQEKIPVMELLRKVREEEILKPSSHDRSLRGDIDLVILKATDKDPHQRYDSASALADEIERLLENRPVEAAAPSAFYHFGKFVRRHTIPVAAAVLSLAALVVGGSIAAVQFHRAVSLSEDLQAKEIEARDAFRNSDFRMAAQLYERRRIGDSIAHLCRALRTDPDHHASASYLLAILTHTKFLKPKAEAGSYPTGVKRIRLPTLIQGSDSGLTVGVTAEEEVLLQFRSDEAEMISFETGYQDAVRFLKAVDRSGRFAISDGNSLQLREFVDPATASIVLLENTEVSALEVESESGLIFAGSSDGKLRVWEAESGELLEMIQAASDPISALSVGRDGALLGFGTSAGGLGLWGWDQNQFRYITGRHRGPVSEVLLSRSGSILASGDHDGSVRISRSPGLADTSGELPHGGAIQSMALSSRFRTLAVGDSDGFTRVWSITTGKIAAPATGFQESVKSLLTIAGDDEFISVGGAGTVRRINAATGYGEVLPGSGMTSVVAMSDDRRSLVAFSDRKKAYRIFELGRSSAMPFRDTEFVTSASNLKDAVAGKDITVRKVNDFQLVVESADRVLNLPRTKSKIVEFAVDYDNGRVATLMENSRLRIWSTVSAEPLTHFLNVPEEMTSLQFTPDPSILEISSSEGSISNYVIPPLGHTLPDWFLTFAETFGGKEFSPDGDVVALPESSLAKAKDEIPENAEKGVALDYAHWLVAERGERALVPGRDHTVAEYVESLLKMDSASALSEILLFDPGNQKAKQLLRDRGSKNMQINGEKDE